ncbi:GATA-like domain-containing protein [Aspergillus lucknowensis]|uniref:Nitrogen regulatory protein areA GATA-like domain-containing protein n=1 Tax=Aspergillus lucknowensis TaxID=176173 RepID=A0ABR4M3M8_9EURO
MPPSHSAVDDISVEEEPSRHVDYLSYKWPEEDLWASWRYVTGRKAVYSNGVRLENASWRAWAKVKQSLGTVAPEKLNWHKDCDVTWLYGPLKKPGDSAMVPVASPPNPTATPSSCPDRKPILKKKTTSEAILQRSLSQHTLLQHAGAILKAQEAEIGQARAPLNRTNTSLDHFHHRTGSSLYSLGGTVTTTSLPGMVSPDERRHVHFKNEVVQCIAVEARDGDEEKDGSPFAFEDDSSDEGLFMTPQLPSRVSISSHCTRSSSFSSERRTIARLPSTTLRYRGDVPETQSDSIMARWAANQPSLMPSPTSSVEVLRPPQWSSEDLLDEDTGIIFADQFASDNNNRYQSLFPLHSANADGDEDEDAGRRLRLATSSTFKPFEEGEEREDTNNSILNSLSAARILFILRYYEYITENLG